MFSSGVYTAQTLHLGLNDFKEGGGGGGFLHGTDIMAQIWSLEIWRFLLI